MHRTLGKIVGSGLVGHLGCQSKDPRFAFPCGDLRFQLMGWDLGVDEQGNAHLFEVNFGKIPG